MNVEEIFIHHKLYGNPGMTHVTTDGKKLYFIHKDHLVYVEAGKHRTFSHMNQQELNDVIEEELLAHVNAR